MESRSRKQNNKTNHLIRFVIGVVIIAGLLIFLFKAPLFQVTKIQVTGNIHLRTSEIIDTAKIANGSNIFSLSKKTVADRLFHLPYVKDISIRKSFPNKVIIDVEERVNTAAYRIGEIYYLIDNDGILLDTSEEPIPDLTVIGGLTVEGMSPGDQTFSMLPNPGMEELLRQLIIEDMLKDFYVIMLGDIDHITLEMFEGTMVEFGELKEVKYKVTFLKEILNDIEMKGLKVTSILMDQGTKPVIVINE